MDIQAIQTYYRGTYYRSRIEARWAVFFDVLGLKHEYEPDKFELPNRRYIPDFRVFTGACCDHQQDVFLEVKGPPPTPDELSKLRDFSNVVGYNRALLVYGGIRDYTLMDASADRIGWYWTQCPFCGSFCASWWRDFHPNCHPLEDFMCPEGIVILQQADIGCFFFKIPRPESPSVNIAMSVAQSARFEDPNFEKIVDSQRHSVLELKRAGVFCKPEWKTQMLTLVESIRKNPACPRWYWEGRPRPAKEAVYVQ